MSADIARELLQGACDIHVHGGPDVAPRRQDIIEMAMEAKEAGYAAVVFKDHNTCTADRAYVAGKFVKDINIFGGIVLNYSTGGFNPHAVEMAIKMGAKVVWMPSVDAAYTIEKVVVTNETPWLKSAVWLKDPAQGLTVLKQDNPDELVEEVKEIMEIVRDAGVILDTCHLSPRETRVLVKAARDLGLEKIVVCHPNCSVNKMSVDLQKELVDLGAYLAYAFLPCMPMYDGQSPAEIAHMIKETGARHGILFSDFGQMQNPTIVEGMRMFVTHLLSCGITEEEIKLMICENPKYLLGIGW